MLETLPELVTQVARSHGDRPALRIKPSFRTRTWTYREIGELVPRAAMLLWQEGLGPGGRILIWAVPRPEVGDRVNRRSLGTGCDRPRRRAIDG